MRLAPEYEEELLKRFQDSARNALRILVDHLEEKDFLAGAYPVADIGCYPYVNMAEQGNVSFEPYPNAQAWCERFRSQPGYISMEE